MFFTICIEINMKTVVIKFLIILHARAENHARSKHSSSIEKWPPPEVRVLRRGPGRYLQLGDQFYRCFCERKTDGFRRYKLLHSPVVRRIVSVRQLKDISYIKVMVSGNTFRAIYILNGSSYSILWSLGHDETFSITKTMQLEHFEI